MVEISMAEFITTLPLEVLGVVIIVEWRTGSVSILLLSSTI
jgi:hypothetical protein